MGAFIRLGVFLFAVVAAMAGYSWYGPPLAYGAEAQAVNEKTVAIRPDRPVAEVRTVLLKRERITETITAYGLVRPISGLVRGYTLPYACRIINVMVSKGQLVRDGEPLLEVSADPDELLRLREAQTEFSIRLTEERLMKKRFNLRLARRSELLGAQSRLKQISLRLKDMRARGIGANKKIYAESESIVYSVDSRVGELLPSGSPLLSLAPKHQIKVIFGLEPEDIGLIREGQVVTLKTLRGGREAKRGAHVQTITSEIDPSTRLVNVVASPDVAKGLLLNDSVEVEIKTASHNTLVVPRSAVLPDGQGYTLFTVLNNRAVRHGVTIGIQTPEKIEVMAEDIHAGDAVVTMGNYELADGMAVRELKAR